MSTKINLYPASSKGDTNELQINEGIIIEELGSIFNNLKP